MGKVIVKDYKLDDEIVKTLNNLGYDHPTDGSYH